MFRKHHKKKTPPILALFRTFISLIMITILGLGVYRAVSHFSHTSTALSHKFDLDSAYQVVSSMLSFNPAQLLSKEKPHPASVTLGVSEQKPTSTTQPTEQPKASVSNQSLKPKLSFRFAIVADSHNDNTDLKKALDQAKEQGAQEVIGLGDYTDVGTLTDLSKAKQVFDSESLPYHLIPGEHDLWNSRNKGLAATADFTSVFGPNYQAFSLHQVGFLLIDNSDDYNGVNQSQNSFIQSSLNQFKQIQDKLIFIFSSYPFYHPTSDHVMGRVEPELKKQAQAMIDLFNSYRVAEVFGGDTHLYTDYTEPKYKLRMITVGAVTAADNLALPRYILVDVYEDGSYNIQDTEIQ